MKRVRQGTIDQNSLIVHSLINNPRENLGNLTKNLLIYDEEENILNIDAINKDSPIIAIININGLKFKLT